MKWLMDYLKKMDKTKWLIVGLFGLLLLVIAIPADNLQDKRQEQSVQRALMSQEIAENEVQQYEKQLEQKLEQALSRMDGVGKVQVIITFRDLGNAVVEKDISRSDGSSAYGEGQYQEETIYEESSGKQPYVSRKEVPSVEGVLVIAQGAGDSYVKKNIQEAMLALFPLEAHKIKIVKMT